MYLYSLTLVLLEILMKSLLSIDAGTVIGPSLAAVGASFAIPLTVKKPLTLQKLEKMRQNMKPFVYRQFVQMYIAGTFFYTDREEEQIRSVGSAAMLVLMMTWAVTLVFTVRPPKGVAWATPLTFLLGALSCVVGLLLAEWSEGKN
jgi:hypothetical protein